MGGFERAGETPGRAPTPTGTVRYQVQVLSWAEVGEDGVSHAEGGRRALVAWPRILHALAAEVGEPEGVRTIVFDLVVERKESGCLVCRFDAEPGSDARDLAVRIVTGLGRARCSRALLDLAADGASSRCFPDLESLAEDALEELGF